MSLYTYTLQRLLTALIPISHLQRAPYSGPAQRLSIRTTDDVDIAATLLSRGRSKLLVICHGFAASQRSAAIVWLAEAMAGPWDVLTFDWRGFGRSGGRASLGGSEARDLAAVVHYARTTGYRRVGVIGESMGGLIVLAAMGAAATDPATTIDVDCVATLAAPADYMLTSRPRPQLLRYVAPIAWLRPIAPLMGFRLGPVAPPRPLDVVSQITMPLLLLQGDADTIVPARNAYLLRDQVPHATLQIYAGVNHGVEAMRARVPQQLLHDLQAHFRRM